MQNKQKLIDEAQQELDIEVAVYNFNFTGELAIINGLTDDFPIEITVGKLKKVVAEAHKAGQKDMVEFVETLLEDEDCIKLMKQDEKYGMTRYYTLSANQIRRNKLRAEQRQALSNLNKKWEIE